MAKLTAKLTSVKAKMALSFKSTDVNLALISTLISCALKSTDLNFSRYLSFLSIYLAISGNLNDSFGIYHLRKWKFNKRPISWIKVSEIHHTQQIWNWIRMFRIIDTFIFQKILKLEFFRESRLLVIFLSEFFKFILRMMKIRPEMLGNWKASEVQACIFHILTGGCCYLVNS